MTTSAEIVLQAQQVTKTYPAPGGGGASSGPGGTPPGKGPSHARGDAVARRGGLLFLRRKA